MSFLANLSLVSASFDLLVKNFKTSSINITGNEKAITKSQSFKFYDKVENMLLQNGIYSITQCNPTELPIANNYHGLAKIPDVMIDIFSDIAFIELSISIITKTVKDKVEALAFPAIKYEHGFFEKS